MILKEWGEIRQLYKDCRPRLAILPWYLSVLSLLLFLSGLVMLGLSLSLSKLVVIVDPTTDSLWVWAIISLLMLIFGLLLFTSEKAFANEFKELYATHGLKHYPWWQRQFYLHYACFLRGLTDRTFPASHETITQLSNFADMAGRPPRPESRQLQPHYIVPYIVLLNLLLLEVLKKADLLEGQRGIYILILSVFVLGLVLVAIWGVRRGWHVVTNWHQVDDRVIQRFLQWAERDIEEA
jgi:hypothetical protein